MKRIAGLLLLCGLLAPLTAAAEVREVIVTFKTHFDIGYTDLASKVVQRYRTTMIDQALKVVEQNRTLPADRQFIWTIPGWPMTKILEDWPGQTPERKQQILQAFKDGRFVVHGLPFTTHTELLEPEDLVRGLGFAAQLSREAGLALPRDAKMTDVPCHSWILPTLLKHAGIDFLHLGCNSASSSPAVPPLFWWEGPDGSRVLTMYTASGYGTGLVPPKDWPYPIWLDLEHTGDNHGPPTPEEVKKLLAQGTQKLPGVKVRIGRLSDFADAIVAAKVDIPVIRGDMPDTWIHGPMCDPAGARIARDIRPALEYAESLSTLLRVWGVAGPEATGLLAQARENSLLYGEHTWGGALSWVTPYGKKLNWSYGDTWKTERAAGRFEKLETSWAEHTAYIEKARDTVTPLIEDSLHSLAQATGPAGRRVVVFNPLPWPRGGVVHLPSGGTGISGLKPADGGPAVAVSQIGDELYFVAPDIPALGYRTFLPAQADEPATQLRNDPKAGIIENEFLKVILDAKRGGIRSLVDKRTGRELTDRNSTYLLGQYLYERFDANQVAAYTSAYVKTRSDWATAELGKPALPSADEAPYQRDLAQPDQLSMGQSAMSVVATMRSNPSAGLPHGVSISVILCAGQPYLDLEVTVQDKPADNWPEAGWLCLPVDVQNPQFHLGRLGGIADPARDFVRGSNHDLQAVHTGVALTDPQGRGVGICPLDSPLVSLGRPGLWRYSSDYVPTTPIVFLNLFNNQWTTNFRLWNEGTWTTRVRLWAFDRFETQSGLVAPALEARYPLQVAAADGRAGPLPPTQTGLEVSARGALVTAFGPNPDGPGTLLRIWEYAGTSGPCTIHLPAGLAAREIQPVNLRGVPTGRPLAVDKDTFTVKLAAYAPASFVIPTSSQERP